MFYNNTLLITIIVMDAVHSFISIERVSRMKLEVSFMNGSVIIDTPTSGLVNTSLVCLNCHVTIFGESLGWNYCVCL